jgi:N-acetylmuramoyl-L-alanine amidase
MERYRPRAGGPDDPLRVAPPTSSRRSERHHGRNEFHDDDWNDQDDWYDGPVGRHGDDASTVSHGPGGRMLAVAGVLFLILSLAVAGFGGMFSRDDDPGDTDLAAIPADELPVTETPAVDETPLVSWDDSPLPTMTLPPADQLERGVEGPYLDGIRTVCIDPGHGGPDRGRVFAGDGNIPPLEEAQFTLEQSFLLQDLLVDRGYIVVMTRTEDLAVNAKSADVNGDGETIADSERAGTYDEIQARINICNRANADLLVSVHINGFDTSRPSGYEAWYTADRPFGEQSAVFAQLGVEALGKRMAEVGYEPENRGAKDDGTYSIDDSDPNLAHNMLLTGPELPGELTPSRMPGAILEPGFITNLDDAAFLLSEDGNMIIALAYADAIDGYFDRFES